MSDSTGNLASDSESDSSSVVEMGSSFNYHRIPLPYDRVELKVIPLFDNSNREKASKNSLEE